MVRLLPIAVMILSLCPLRAEAVSARDILELSRAGLGEEVLLALIEVDGGVFSLDTATLTSLKQAGVSERVILAMVRSGRSRPAEPVAPQTTEANSLQPRESESPPPQVVVAPPQVIVIEHEPVVQQVAVPVYFPVSSKAVFGRSRRVIQPHLPFDPSPGFGAPLPQQFVPHVKGEPVYWGWGGKLRPDAWKPDNHEARTDRRRPDHPNRK